MTDGSRLPKKVTFSAVSNGSVDTFPFSTETITSYSYICDRVSFIDANTIIKWLMTKAGEDEPTSALLYWRWTDRQLPPTTTMHSAI